MKPFPSPQERSVASALLLLSITSAVPPPSSPPSLGHEAKQLSLSFGSMSSGKTGSRSCTSSLTSDASSSKAPIRSLNQLKAMGVAAARSCNTMNVKVARKKRTQVVRWTSSDRGGFPRKTGSTSGSASTEHDSCVSSASFASSAAERGNCFTKAARANQTPALLNKRKKAQSVDSARLRRRSEAIMTLLSGGRFSEVSIRQVLGDSPDTSKALRILLRREDIERSGSGGRCDPYIYTAAR